MGDMELYRLIAICGLFFMIFCVVFGVDVILTIFDYIEDRKAGDDFE